MLWFTVLCHDKTETDEHSEKDGSQQTPRFHYQSIILFLMPGLIPLPPQLPEVSFEMFDSRPMPSLKQNGKGSVGGYVVFHKSSESSLVLPLQHSYNQIRKVRDLCSSCMIKQQLKRSEL